jgi:hypothetical protein
LIALLSTKYITKKLSTDAFKVFYNQAFNEIVCVEKFCRVFFFFYYIGSQI